MKSLLYEQYFLNAIELIIMSLHLLQPYQYMQRQQSADSTALAC